MAPREMTPPEETHRNRYNRRRVTERIPGIAEPEPRIEGEMPVTVPPLVEEHVWRVIEQQEDWIDGLDDDEHLDRHDLRRPGEEKMEDMLLELCYADRWGDLTRQMQFARSRCE